MMKTKLLYVVSLLVIASMVLTACGANASAPTEAPSSSGGPVAPGAPAATEAPVATEVPAAIGPKVLNGVLTGSGDIPTIDAAISEDVTSHQIVKETTIGLTNLNEETSAIEPGMAEKWDTVNNADGTQTVTFHMRKNVPWVRWNGDAVETVKTCDGKADRMVTAGDFAYGIYRNQLPANASPYAYLFGFILKGAADFNAGKTEDFSTVGVKVVDDSTLEMTFLTQAVYNVQIAGLWVARAQPKWLIEGEKNADGSECVAARGERWTEPGFFQSYGPYTVSEWIHDSSITLVKNSFWPASDAIPQPKIDIVNLAILDDPASLGEYEAGNVDFSGVPLADMDRVKTDAVLSKELFTIPDTCSYFYGFNTKAPFVDDVRVRRALSLAIDRQSLIDNVVKGGQLPAQWFSMPGLAGGPTLENHPDLGVKYDVEKAKAELQSYLDEKKLTADQLDLTLMFNTSAGHQKIAEAIQQMWKDNLGVNVKVVNQEWKVFLVTTKSKATPQIWRAGWCQDYPDANNFDRDVFAVAGANNPAENGEPFGGVNWKNPIFEDIVTRAAVETDPAKRVEMYAEAEKIMNWDDAIMIPIYWYTKVGLTKPYVVRTFGLGGAQAFEKWDILPH